MQKEQEPRARRRLVTGSSEDKTVSILMRCIACDGGNPNCELCAGTGALNVTPATDLNELINPPSDGPPEDEEE